MKKQGKSEDFRNRDKDHPPSKEEVFAKMNASAARMLEALQGAYHAGMRAGITDEQEGQLIELLRRAKEFREHIKGLTEDPTDIQSKEEHRPRGQTS